MINFGPKATLKVDAMEGGEVVSGRSTSSRVARVDASPVGPTKISPRVVALLINPFLRIRQLFASPSSLYFAGLCSPRGIFPVFIRSRVRYRTLHQTLRFSKPHRPTSSFLWQEPSCGKHVYQHVAKLGFRVVASVVSTQIKIGAKRSMLFPYRLNL